MSEEHESDLNKADFHRAVFDVLNTHSLPDLNLGLCIAHLTDPDDPTRAFANLEKLSCRGKIDALRKIVRPEMASSFERWMQEAAKVRAIRNEFAHGVWEYLPLNEDAPVGLRMPPWFSHQENVQARDSLGEILELAAEAKDSFDEFMAWRRSSSI